MGVALQIYLLGRFTVARGGLPLPASAWRRRRPADLLKLLALTPGRALPREAVFDALWPDKDPAAAANNLHRALYDLRHSLAGPWVEVDHGTVALRGTAWVDAEALEQAVRRGGLEAQRAAVALYAGDLSPEDPESAWLVPHRRRLRSLFAEAAHAVARQEALDGHPAEAMGLLRRLLQVEPASEEAHRLLMRLLAEDGRAAEALRQFQACSAARQAVGLGRPSLTTAALRDAIESGELGVERLRPWRGREGVVASLEALLERGHGLVVLLEERGAGATRLALEAGRLAEARGWAVLWAAPRASGPGSGTLFGELLEHGGGGLALPEALATAAAGRPTFLQVDDLHLADDASLDQVVALTRRAAELRLVMVATCREDAIHAGTPIQRWLAALDDEGLARGLHVPGAPGVSLER